jgi:hypothetical protein
VLTAGHYRARATEYDNALSIAHSAAERKMLQGLKQSYLSLAEHMEWLATNRDKVVRPHREHRESPMAPADRENILRYLGAAVIVRWNTIPTKLQRELFEDASTIEDLQQAAPLKEALARFLHNHKDDAQLVVNH